MSTQADTRPKFVPFAKMVSDLFKRFPSEPESFLHAVVGMMTEIGEVLDQAKKFWVYQKPLDMKNILEELGDLHFYYVAGCLILGEAWTNYITYHVPDGKTPSQTGGSSTTFHGINENPQRFLVSTASMYRIAGRISDWSLGLVSDYATDPQAEIHVSKKALLDWFELGHRLYSFMAGCGFTLEEVERANQLKLIIGQDGKPPRYPQGVYSDADAVARADKPEEKVGG